MSDLSGCELVSRDCDDCDCDCDCDTDCGNCDVSGSCMNQIEELELPPAVQTTWDAHTRPRSTHSVPAASNEQITNYRPTAEALNGLYMQSIFYLLRFITLAFGFAQVSWSVLGTSYKAIRKSLGDNLYVFFEGSSYPYALDDLKLDSPGVPPIEWYYNAKTNTFVTARLYANSQSYHLHHIPYLAAEIKYNDLSLYDISDFTNSVHWAGEDGEPMPSVDHLVSVWTLSSGVVLRRSNEMALQIINSDGNDLRMPLRNGA